MTLFFTFSVLLLLSHGSRSTIATLYQRLSLSSYRESFQNTSTSHSSQHLRFQTQTYLWKSRSWTNPLRHHLMLRLSLEALRIRPVLSLMDLTLTRCSRVLSLLHHSQQPQKPPRLSTQLVPVLRHRHLTTLHCEIASRSSRVNLVTRARRELLGNLRGCIAS